MFLFLFFLLLLLLLLFYYNIFENNRKCHVMSFQQKALEIFILRFSFCYYYYYYWYYYFCYCYLHYGSTNTYYTSITPSFCCKPKVKWKIKENSMKNCQQIFVCDCQLFPVWVCVCGHEKQLFCRSVTRRHLQLRGPHSLWPCSWRRRTHNQKVALTFPEYLFLLLSVFIALFSKVRP